MSAPRLFAEPIRKIDLPDACGYLYRWDNGDTQMFWIVAPPQKGRCEVLGASPQTRGSAQ